MEVLMDDGKSIQEFSCWVKEHKVGKDLCIPGVPFMTCFIYMLSYRKFKEYEF